MTARARPAAAAGPGVDLPPGAVAVLRHAAAIMVLTGSGVSAESGIPTFRDALTGVWARFDPAALASRAGYLRDPARSWRWYAERRAHARAAAPNAAHRALAALERQAPGMVVVTQNVDGLHQRAGSRKVIELHGSLERARCFDEDTPVDGWESLADADASTPPRCPRCGGPLRPDVVWFGEMLPPTVLRAAFDAAAGCDVFLSIGTSGIVEPAAWLPFIALERGATVIEVNPAPTPLSAHATHVVRGPAGVVVPALLRAAGDAAAPPADGSEARHAP